MAAPFLVPSLPIPFLPFPTRSLSVPVPFPFPFPFHRDHNLRGSDDTIMIVQSVILTSRVTSVGFYHLVQPNVFECESSPTSKLAVAGGSERPSRSNVIVNTAAQPAIVSAASRPDSRWHQGERPAGSGATAVEDATLTIADWRVPSPSWGRPAAANPRC